MSNFTLHNTDTILALLQPERLDEDRFRGQSHFMGAPHVFGGQVLGQSLHAATSTVEGRRPHSLHALFLLPGKLSLPVDYEVERVRDGGSFSTRRVVATQEGRRIFVMSASFQTAEEGLSHQKTAPVVGVPEAAPSLVEQWQERAHAAGREFSPVPVDLRAAFLSAPNQPGVRQVWSRAPQRLPDDPIAHETLFAYVSDYGLLWTAMQPHGVRFGDPHLQMASLDHTIWFHRPFRMDEWLLFDCESPSASGGRGLSTAQVYNAEGVLVATVAQEGLIRMRSDKAAR